jgi:hypothetical protein
VPKFKFGSANAEFIRLFLGVSKPKPVQGEFLSVRYLLIGSGPSPGKPDGIDLGPGNEGTELACTKQSAPTPVEESVKSKPERDLNMELSCRGC